MIDYVAKAKNVDQDYMHRGRKPKRRDDPGLKLLALAYVKGEVTYSQVCDVLVTYGFYKQPNPGCIMGLMNELRDAIVNGEFTPPTAV